MSEAKLSRRDFLKVALAITAGTFLVSQFENIVNSITEGIQDPESNLEFLKRLGENLYDKSVTENEAQKAIIETLLVVNGLQNLSKFKVPLGYEVRISTYDSSEMSKLQITDYGTSFSKNWPSPSKSYDASVVIEIFGPLKNLTNLETNEIPQSIKDICGENWSPSTYQDYKKFATENPENIGIINQNLAVSIFDRPGGALYIEKEKKRYLKGNLVYDKQDSYFAKLDGENKIFDISQHDYEEMMQLK